MPCPRCVGECHCALGRADERTVLVDPEGYDPSEEQFSQSLVAARHPEPRETVAVPPVENGNPVNEPVWRHEVAQRLTRYRSRRGHAAHNQSLSFNFDPLPEAPVTMEPIADSNLIEFPRAIQRAAPMERLAEPVEELTPRIFEAEEPAVHEEEAGDSTAAQEFFDTIDDDEEAMHDDLNTSVAIAPLLPSFTLDPIPALGENDMPVQVELPLQVAPLGLRGVVALLDLAVALLATGLFSFIVKQFGALPSDPKILFAAEAFAITFFWFLYQLLYLSYAGRTLGMAVTGTRLCCFDAKYVTRLRRQMRAFSMLLSALSAGLGFAWAFFDEDALCWHDRITRTAVR